MNFSFLKEFNDLPRGGVKFQKEHLRTGTELNVQTALALYRNRERLRNYYFLTFFPIYSYLCGNDFLQNMWKEVKFNKIDSVFVFGSNNLSVVEDLLYAKKLIYVLEKLLLDSIDWSYVEKAEFLRKLNETLSEIYRLPNVAKQFNSFSKKVSEFKYRLSAAFCEERIQDKEAQLLSSDWKSFSGWVKIVKQEYIQYSPTAFELDKYKERIDWLVRDFIENKRCNESGVTYANIYDFRKASMSEGEFVSLLEGLLKSKNCNPELLNLMISEGLISKDEADVIVWSGVAYPNMHAS